MNTTNYARILIGDLTSAGLFAGCDEAAPTYLWATVAESCDLPALRKRYIGIGNGAEWLLPADAWTVEIVPAERVAELLTNRDTRTASVPHELVPGYGV